MPSSMFDPAVRARFQERIRSLSPNARRRWGRMTSSQMVCHLIDQLRIALGELPTRPVSGIVRYPPFKQLVINARPALIPAALSPGILVAPASKCNPKASAADAVQIGPHNEEEEGKLRSTWKTETS